MWSSVPAAMISAFGSMAVAEAAAYLLLTDELIAQFIRAFNRSAIHLWLSIRGHGQDPSRRYGFGFSEAPCSTHSTRQLTARRGNLSPQMQITT
jgi:hypothetical protein